MSRKIYRKLDHGWCILIENWILAELFVISCSQYLSDLLLFLTTFSQPILTFSVDSETSTKWSKEKARRKNHKGN